MATKEELDKQHTSTAQQIVKARYGQGPAATANAIAYALRTTTDEMIKAGVEAALVAASIERAACAAIARAWRDGNPDAVARCDWTGQQIAQEIEARSSRSGQN